MKDWGLWLGRITAIFITLAMFNLVIKGCIAGSQVTVTTIY